MNKKTSNKLMQWINTPTTVKTVNDWSIRMGIIAFFLVKIMLAIDSMQIELSNGTNSNFFMILK